MATPIRYVPQVIPTDLGQGLLQEQDRRQGQYDAAFSGMNQAEDQFGQFQVDPSDIAGKNYVLGQFKDKTKAIVDKYGGDYGVKPRRTLVRLRCLVLMLLFKRTYVTFR
jgi:hypothetical protein